ncbi:MAG: choice-of-anchor Q domain-containing protein [Synechococcus sp.]
MATFTVSNTNDSGSGSLRKAILDANNPTTNPGADRIVFAPSLDGKTITLSTGELGITDSLTIDGDRDDDGKPDITVDANQKSNVFTVKKGDVIDFSVELDGLEIRNGIIGIQHLSDGSDASFSSGNFLSVRNSTVTGNSNHGISNQGSTEMDGYGSELASTTSLKVINSQIKDNGKDGIYNGRVYSYYYGASYPNAGFSGNNLQISRSYIGSNSGNGVTNQGELDLTDSEIRNNSGDGISSQKLFESFSNKSINIQRSSISNNGGDGIENNFDSHVYGFKGGYLSIVDSTISGNQNLGVNNSAYATVANSTIVENLDGGISSIGSRYSFDFSPQGKLEVFSSTIAENQGVGIINSEMASVSIESTIVANNTISDLVNNSGVINASNSLIESDADQINGTNSNNILGQDPLLEIEGLKDNGGSTQTIALRPGSPAINAGSNPQNFSFDQRGKGFRRTVGQADIGAFEVQSGGPTPSANPLLFSLKKNQTINGLAVKTDDIVQFDGEKFSTFFDGSDVGLGGKKPAINAFDVIGDKKVLLSFERNFWLKGFGNVNRSDVLLFEATSLGHRTRGRFSKYFDGSDVGLNGYAENIDGLTGLPNGNLLISTRGNLRARGGYSARNEDVSLFEFGSNSTGNNTKGTFSQYFDGGDVGLGSRRVNAFSLDESDLLLFSTDATFMKGSLKAENEDVFAFEPRRLGTTTRGSFVEELFFDGSQYGLQSNDIFAVDSTFNAI